MRASHQGIFFFLLIALCFSWNLGWAPLSGTEGHRAITAHQMNESGAYLIPRLYGQTYLRKPPLAYWVIALFEKALGPHEAVWRLPSVLSAALLGGWLAYRSSRLWGTLSGWVTGFVYMSIIPLWSQFRSADIDAMNTLASVAAVVFLLDVHQSTTRRFAGVWAGLSLGAAFLLKGPACLPLMAAALTALFLLRRDGGAPRRWWKTAGTIAMGIGLFSLYAAAAAYALHAAGESLDLSGIREANAKVTGDWLERLSLPFVLLLYGLPFSLVLRFCFKASGADEACVQQRTAASFFQWTFLLSLLYSVMMGLDNPRYGYMFFPLLAMLCGAAVRFHPVVLRWAPALTALLYAVVQGVLFVQMPEAEGITRTGLIAVTVLTGLALAHGLFFTWRRRQQTALLGCALVMVLTVFPFAHYKNISRFERSGHSAAQLLSLQIKPAERIITGLMLWTHPEIFHYAGVSVDAVNRYQFEKPYDMDKEGWVLFHGDEWRVWSAVYTSRLSRITAIPTHVSGTVLAWYENE